MTERRNDTVQFGNGNTEQATLLQAYPLFIQTDYRGSTHQAVVRPNCPMRVSKAVLSDWDADLCMGRSEITLNKFIVTIPFTDEQVLAIDIIVVGIGGVRRQWTKTPKWYKLCDSGHWASSEKEC